MNQYIFNCEEKELYQLWHTVVLSREREVWLWEVLNGNKLSQNLYFGDLNSLLDLEYYWVNQSIWNYSFAEYYMCPQIYFINSFHTNFLEWGRSPWIEKWKMKQSMLRLSFPPMSVRTTYICSSAYWVSPSPAVQWDASTGTSGVGAPFVPPKRPQVTRWWRKDLY